MSSKEKFIPYFLPSIGKDEIFEVVDSLKNNWLTMGPKVIAFEKALEDYLGVKHVITLNSCTAALHLSLIVSGLKIGDEVITSPLTFAATGNTIAHLGLKPVLVDINPETLNIDPKRIESAITPKTKAIVVVHYGGKSADLNEITSIANNHNLTIIEDAAHAIGTLYNGKKIGNHGNLTCYSFYATKNMTTGEGGAIATNNDEIAKRLRKLRLHGISKDAWKRYQKEGSWYYEIEECGWKYNLTDIQAAIGLHQIKKLDSFIRKRQELAKLYNTELSKIKGIKLPYQNFSLDDSLHLYPIILENYNRDQFIKKMAESKIGTSVHFIPLHLHPFYKKAFKYKEGNFPETEKIFKGLVSLPLYPKMSKKDVEKVVKTIKDIISN